MGLSQMDVPTRQSYGSKWGWKDDSDRNHKYFKKCISTISPSIAGSILQSLSFLSAPFIIGGVLKIIYDIAL